MPPKKKDETAPDTPFATPPERSMFDKRSDSEATDEAIAPLSGNIDDRMAALLADHQRMGARPK